MGKNMRRRMDQLKLTELLDRFQVYNRAANKSAKTLEWYATSISRYHQYLQDELGREPTLADVSPLSARAFIVTLQECGAPRSRFGLASPPRPLSSETINSYVRALRAFTRFLQEDGFTSTWLLERVKPPRVEHKLKDALDPEDICNQPSSER